MSSDRENYCGRCRMYCAPGAPCTHCRPFPRPHTMARDVMDAYEERVPDAREARLNDATAQYAHHVTVHLLDVACAAMQDEGIDAGAWYRVLQAMVYGGSNPADVELRAAEQARFAEYVAGDARPTPLVFNVADSGEVERMLLHIKPKDGDDA